MNWNIFALVIWLVALLLLWRRFGPKAAGRKIRNNLQALYDQTHVYEQVEARRFRDLDHKFYDASQRRLEQLGFHKIADIENLSITKLQPNLRTFTRLMTSADGSITAAIYHLRFRSLFMRLLSLCRILPRVVKVVEFQTGFANGTFLCTGNTNNGLNALSQPPGFHNEMLDEEATPEQSLSRHLQIMEEWQARGEDFLPLPVLSLEDYLAAAERERLLKKEWRENIGYLSDGEMARMAGAGPAMKRQIMKEIHKINHQEQKLPLRRD